MLRVFIDSKKPIAFAFNLRFYRAILFRKGLISCLPVRTAQAQPELFVRLRAARWNVNIRNVVITRKPANGSSPGEGPKSLPREKLTVAKVRMPKEILLNVIFTALGHE